MKKLLKMLLCGLFAVGIIVLADSYVIHAEDNTLIADLDGDGTEEIIYYEPDIKLLEGDETDYTFKISINGKEAWSEGYLIVEYPEKHRKDRLQDPLYTLDYLHVSVIDVNPGDKVKEIAVEYYSSYNEMLLGIKIFRLEKDKLVLVGEDYDMCPYAYILAPQKNNKRLILAEDSWSTSFGCLWIKKDYKIRKDRFVEKKPANGIYTVAKEFSNDGTIRKFKAARNIKVFSDIELTDFKDEILKGQKFRVKKVKFIEKTYDFYAYIKTTTGLTGWIYVENGYGEESPEKLVENRRLFG